jgi:hypothetical protein
MKANTEAQKTRRTHLLKVEVGSFAGREDADWLGSGDVVSMADILSSDFEADKA